MIELEDKGFKWKFSSPFIEERLYFPSSYDYNALKLFVLVPFYRGAVVFISRLKNNKFQKKGSRPLLSRSGCIYLERSNMNELQNLFSSPFIEERLYLRNFRKYVSTIRCSRPLLSRSGCISSTFLIVASILSVLVPFYRGAVVFL